jgi:hypothetical protein
MDFEEINLEMSEIAENDKNQAIDLVYEDMIREIEEYWLSYVFDYESEWDF